MKNKWSYEIGAWFYVQAKHYASSLLFLIVRGLLGCLSVLLRSQETESWKLSSTIRYLDSILLFAIDRRPKVRKAAQHAICAILATKEDSQQVRKCT